MRMHYDFLVGCSPAHYFVCSNRRTGRRTGRKPITLALLGFLIVACDTSGPDVTAINPDTGRWYGNELRNQGEAVFTVNCASCHGGQAQGLAEDWRARQADGSFPPPPLNGSAHAWHHPLSVLLQVIDEGGTALGGNMPGFASQLNRQEKLAAIAYFQDFWSDDIYAQWQQMGGTD